MTKEERGQSTDDAFKPQQIGEHARDYLFTCVSMDH